jgi:anti-sigma B factor antagonist
MSSSLSIKASVQGDVVILHLGGALDASTSPAVDAAIKKLIVEGRKNIVVEMSGLSFIASAGLGLLAALRKQLKTSGGDLRIASPTAAVLDVFKLLSFDKVFSISARLEDAVSGF